MITVKLCGRPGEAGITIHAETIDDAIRIIKDPNRILETIEGEEE